MSPEELLVTNIVYNFRRTQALLLLITLLSATILSNLYLDEFSFDEELVLHADVFKSQMEARIEKLELENKSKSKSKSKSEGEGEGEGESKSKSEFSEINDLATKLQRFSAISELKARVIRLDNLKRDYKFRNVTFPLTGLVIPANDFSIVAGIFLLILSAWLSFSIRQIQLSIHNGVFESLDDKYLIVINNSVLLSFSSAKGFLQYLLLFIFFFPAITMGLAFLQAIIEVATYDFESALLPIMYIIIIRLLVFMGLTAFMIWASLFAIKCRKELINITENITIAST